ncbi:SET and MYND domain-containing protein 4-like [Linepithema humile]|uniref:SET and MYND domain-containing protein 4-like n=1 Tax=Linepithema humile TaxID=83485 RepID=UPI000623930C|nr:PREDICTED: SET and MYND domain-containing protein 4-like [Linepithema humile]
MFPTIDKTFYQNVEEHKFPRLNMRWNRYVDCLTYLTETYGLRMAVRIMAHEGQLMNHLMNNQDMHDSITQWLQYNYNLIDKKKHKKDLDVSIAHKLTGNQEFQAKNYAASLESYTKSAIFAPLDSEELSIAIGNRSASLFQLNRLVDCIKDIKLALKFNYPDHLRHKLYLREAECYLKLGERIPAIEAVIKARAVVSMFKSCKNKEQLQKKLNEVRSKASQLKDDADDADDADDENTANTTNTTEFSQPQFAFGENPDFQFASAAVSLDETLSKGRHVVANRDIKKGQVLFIEKAFAFVPLNIYEMNHVCHHCCRTITAEVCTPCTTCIDVLYCDLECLEKARPYHRWECLGYQLCIWSQIGIAYLALKMLFISVLTTDIDKFNDVQVLMTNFDQANPSDTISYALTASLLTHYLSGYTDFFESVNLKECLASKFTDEHDGFSATYNLDRTCHQRLFVGSLLLKYILQLVANGYAITKINTTLIPDSCLRVQQQDRIATAIYPTASFMNHSCNPNVINSFMDDVLIVKAVRDIKENEEIVHCYGPDFRRMPRSERQERLKSQYCFKCSCNACTSPEYKFFLEKFSALKCPECSGPLRDADSQFSCMDCGKVFKEINYGLSLGQAKMFFDEGVTFLNNNQYPEAINKFMQCLSIRREILYKLHNDITKTFDYIARVYAKAEQWLNSITYIEYTMIAVEEKYGPSSIEVCYELNKLTDICITYLQNESKTQTKFYKNILKKTRRYLNRSQEIVDLAYGPWSVLHNETVVKKKVLEDILKDYNV